MASRLNIEDAIYIENDGQVGINVQEPSDQFEVNGTISGNISTGDQWLKQATGSANKCIHHMNTSEGGVSITKYGNDLRFENPHDTVRATLDNSGVFTVQGTANANALNVTGEFKCASNKVVFDNTAAYFAQNIIQLGAWPTLNKAIIDSSGSNIRLSSPGNTGALEVNSDGDTVLLGHLNSKGAYLNCGVAATDTRPALTTSSIGNYEIRGYGTNGTASNEGFLRLSSGGGSGSTNQAYIDICGYNTNSDMNKTITFGTAGVERLRVDLSGNVGIGNNDPATLLDISTPSITTPLLTLRSGNGSTAFNDGAQIQFGYAGNNSYNHYIHTRHNSADGYNAIDFYVCDGTENNTMTSGSKHAMSLVSGWVGIGTSTPSALLTLEASNGYPYIHFNQSGTIKSSIGYNLGADALLITSGNTEVSGNFKVTGNDGFSGAVVAYNCERNGSYTTANDDIRMAYGNGSSGAHGPTMPKNGTVLGLTFSASGNSSCQLHLMDNDSETGDYISATSTTATNIAEGMHNFSAGDRIGMKLKVISGTTSNIVGSFIVRFD